MASQRRMNQRHRVGKPPAERTTWEHYLLDLMSSDPPTKAMWASVVNQAIRDVKRGGRLGDEARAWLLADDEGVGGFAWVCEQLPLTPSLVRRDVLGVEQQYDAS